MGQHKREDGTPLASNEPDVITTAAQGQLKAFVQRIQNLMRERDGINDDIKEVAAEAKGMGFDTKTIRKVIRLLAMDPSKRQEEEAILDLYMHAVGAAPEAEDDCDIA